MVCVVDLLFDCRENLDDSISARLDVTLRTIANFYFIGAVAFFIDASIYFFSGWLFQRFGLDIEPGFRKVFGLIGGLLTTYAYNAKVTFSSRYSWISFIRYSSTQLFGLIVNLSVFSVLVLFLNDLFALVIATFIASVANYLGARFALKRKNGA